MVENYSIYMPQRAIPTWDIWYYDSGWTRDGVIPRGGVEEFIDVWDTSSQTLILADGSQARTSPEHYHTREKLVITIPAQHLTTAYKSKFKAYMSSGAGLRVQTHESGAGLSTTYLEGYVMSLADTWKLSGGKQKHVYEIGFQMFDVDGSGAI